MNILNEDYFSTIFPNTLDVCFSKLPKKIKEEYMNCYSLYSKWFTEYLVRNTNIKKIEDNIDKLNLDLINPNVGDIYQYLAQGVLKYFYIRNNMNLSNLTKQEYNFLCDRVSNNKYEYDEFVEKFITITFKKVIFVNKQDREKLLNYGPSDNKKYYIHNGDLILGYRFFYELDENINQNEINYLNNLFQNLQDNISKKLKIESSIIYYSDDAVLSLSIK